MANMYNMLSIGNKKFWCGAIDVSTGKILEVHKHEEADLADYHTDFYFSEKVSGMLNLNEAVFFWYNNGKIDLDDSEHLSKRMRDQLKKAILSKVKVIAVIKHERTVSVLSNASDRELAHILLLIDEAIKTRVRVKDGTLRALLSLDELTASELKSLVHNEIIKRWVKLQGKR